MAKQRRTFSTEFKHECVALVLDQGYSLMAAARSMGVGDTALRHWVEQLRQERSGITLKIHAALLVSAVRKIIFA